MQLQAITNNLDHGVVLRRDDAGFGTLRREYMLDSRSEINFE